MTTQRPFGKLPTGQDVTEYTLANERGMIVKAINYGAIITQLHVPDRNGKSADVVLGFDNLDQYVAGHPYFGCIAGRVAGRITGGKFTLDGKDYQLAINDPPNHLHGGKVGFDKRIWAARQTIGILDQPRLEFEYTSINGEEGYPGTVTVTVGYTIAYGNEFHIDFKAVTDRPTPLNLTSHSYFNLAGEDSGSIEDHELQIFADDYSRTDEFMTHLGKREHVLRNGSDFKKPKRVGDALPGILNQHGDNYFVRWGQPVSLAEVARLVDPSSGRVMRISSTMPCVQFYSGRFLDGTLRGKTGRAYHSHAGLCLECQGYPNGVNDPHLGNIVLRPEQTYHHVTMHKFSTDTGGRA
jgi:aldose 1-epimerase